MARYVDGFVQVAPKKKVKAYQAIAARVGKIYMKNGALAYFECVGDDLNGKWVTLPFPKMVRAKPGEAVLFSFIVYKSRAHRDAVNKKAMMDAYMQPENWKDRPTPMDMKRVAYGGFKTLVDLQ